MVPCKSTAEELKRSYVMVSFRLFWSKLPQIRTTVSNFVIHEIIIKHKEDIK